MERSKYGWTDKQVAILGIASGFAGLVLGSMGIWAITQTWKSTWPTSFLMIISGILLLATIFISFCFVTHGIAEIKRLNKYLIGSELLTRWNK